MSEDADRRIRLNSTLYVHSVEDVIAYLFEDYKDWCSDWDSRGVDNLERLCYRVAELVVCNDGITPEEGAKVIAAVAVLPEEVTITVKKKRRACDLWGLSWSPNEYSEVSITVPMCNIIEKAPTQIESGTELSKDILFVFEF